MDQQFTAALARRLAAYSATAGVALAVAPSVGAQVVYHDYEPDITGNPVGLDFDDDGAEDLRLEIDYCYGRCSTIYLWLVRPVGANQENGVLGYGFPPLYWVASHLEDGDVIGSGQDFYRAAFLAENNYFGNAPFGPFAGQEGYAGFRFVSGDGELHYGWLRLSAPSDSVTPTVYGYAYEATPDAPIYAGAVSDALLDGAVNQTDFPASGGTLVYTFAVENTADDPLPLDLWIEADGPASFTRRLGSGTLPAGTTVTRSVRVRVPPGAPAGTYDVRFKLGDFASRQFITFERYAITKEATVPAAGGAEAFVVEPVAGDLFAEADAATALTGTHALSAPVPNPSSGRSELTLAVSEAQHVSVSVYDALGRRVAVLHEGVLVAGAEHRIAFDGSGLPAGVYVVRAVGAAFTDTRVLTLTR